MLKLYDGILDLLDGLRRRGVKVGPGDLQVALHHADGLRPHRHRGLLRRHGLRRREHRATSRCPDPILCLPGAAGCGAGRRRRTWATAPRTCRRRSRRAWTPSRSPGASSTPTTLEAEKPDVLVHTIPELAEVLGHLGARRRDAVATRSAGGRRTGGRTRRGRGATRRAARARSPSRVPLLRARQPRDLRRRLRRPLPRAAGARGGASRSWSRPTRPPSAWAASRWPAFAQVRHGEPMLSLANAKNEDELRAWHARVVKLAAEAGLGSADGAGASCSSPRSTAWPCRCATRTAG